MKDLKEQIIEIAKNTLSTETKIVEWGLGEDYQCEISGYDKLADEILALPLYPKEFVEWLHGKDYLYDKLTDTWITSLEAAYSYWKLNIKEK